MKNCSSIDKRDKIKQGGLLLYLNYQCDIRLKITFYNHFRVAIVLIFDRSQSLDKIICTTSTLKLPKNIRHSFICNYSNYFFIFGQLT